MLRISLIAAACLLPTFAHAQIYTCTMLQHWRNSAMNGELLPADVGVSDTHNVIHPQSPNR